MASQKLLITDKTGKTRFETTAWNKRRNALKVILDKGVVGSPHAQTIFTHKIHQIRGGHVFDIVYKLLL